MTLGSWLLPTVGANENRRKTCLGATETRWWVSGICGEAQLETRAGIMSLSLWSTGAGDALPGEKGQSEGTAGSG